MRTHIDWLTFTMTPEFADESDEGYGRALNSAFVTMFTKTLAEEAFGGKWEVRERSRAPYREAWTLDDGNITLFAARELTHCCVEISGQGCENLIQRELLNRVLDACKERVTRIDIACDIETKIRPREFTSVLRHGRMKSGGYQYSESGETQYVGSQKSDRYARVYRYFEPHPRAHLLRVEHVFRKDYAKIVAKECLHKGLNPVAEACAKAFGWTHSDFDLSTNETADINLVAPERGMGKTVTWLVTSCAPAFRRLVADGTIKDPDEFIRRYFLPPE